MPTQEIKAIDWDAFCQRFNRLHRGGPIKIEILDTEANWRVFAAKAPFRSIRFDQSDPCNTRLLVEVGAIKGDSRVHTVTEPIHLKVREEGGRKQLQIDAEEGSALITFHTGRLAELMEGLE